MMKIPTHRTPTAPGTILRELFLEPAGITQLQLARHLGWTPAKINNIISGRLGISAETALSLADAFATTPELWLSAQAAVDLWNARHHHVVRKKLIRVARPAA